MNLLFTCAGRRNYLLNYFKESIDPRDIIIAVDSDYAAPALADADLAFTVPPIKHPEYIINLKNIIDRFQIDMVISLNDLELPLLAKNKTYLESSGAQVIVSNEKIVSIASDKWKTYSFFQKLNIPTPLSFLSVTDALNAISEKSIDFPLILKPRWGTGSIGIKQVDNPRELHLGYEWLNVEIKKSVLHDMNCNNVDEAIIIQEKLMGQEYGMDILNDFEGMYYDSFVRKKLAMRSGETDKATSVINKNFSDIGRIIAGATEHVGIMDCDFFVANKKIYFLEMNPRFGEGYPLSHAAGINVPGIYIEWLKGGMDVDKYNNYKNNLTFLKCDRIVRSPHLKKSLSSKNILSDQWRPTVKSQI